jgi:AcrR family transcriptional regulator
MIVFTIIMSIADSDIMRVAENLFAERGYTSVSTREIAQKAGITEMTLFRKFHTKRELFIRILKEAWNGDSTLTAMSALIYVDSKDELKAFMKTIFEAFRAQRKIAKILAISPELLDKELFELVQSRLIQAHQDTKDFLVQLLKRDTLPEEIKKRMKAKDESDYNMMALHIMAQIMGFFLLDEVFKISSPDIWDRLEQDFTDRLVELFF